MLGERLDAEVLRDVQTRYFAAAENALRSHGGQVEKYIGDAVMCVFGLPAAHEDDALRAVRGALDVIAAVERLNAELRDELDVELAVRVGVNTGEVVAGGGERSGQALVTGDTVNTAARLEQAAPAGGILLGDLTHRLVARFVDAEAEPPVAAKGKAAPLSVWRLRGLQSGAAGLVSRAAGLVGRDEELDALRAGLERVANEAPRGMDDRQRRRRHREIAGWLRSCSRSCRRGARSTAPARAMAAATRIGRCGDVLEIIAPVAPEGRLVELLASQPEAQMTAQRLLSLTGYRSGTLRREEAFGAVERLFAALAADEPLVVAFEDLHWAEPTFLDLLEFLGESLEAPVLLIGTAREELFGERPAWPPSRCTSSRSRPTPRRNCSPSATA